MLHCHRVDFTTAHVAIELWPLYALMCYLEMVLVQYFPVEFYTCRGAACADLEQTTTVLDKHSLQLSYYPTRPSGIDFVENIRDSQILFQTEMVLELYRSIHI